MRSRISLFTIVTAAALSLSAITFLPMSTSAQDTTNRAEIEKIVREYLLGNPEILIEMQDVLESREQEKVAASQKKTLEEKRDIIYASANQIEIGDPNAKITIVEFFDYNCGFCLRAMNDMTRLLESDNNIRFVLKEFPVLGEASVEAHRVSLAFSKLVPEKYGEFHLQLLGLNGPKDGNRAMQLAISMGAEETALRAEMEKPFVVESFRETYDLADDLGISGTPSYVVGDEIIFGAVGYDQLQQRIAKLSE